MVAALGHAQVRPRPQRSGARGVPEGRVVGGAWATSRAPPPRRGPTGVNSPRLPPGGAELPRPRHRTPPPAAPSPAHVVYVARHRIRLEQSWPPTTQPAPTMPPRRASWRPRRWSPPDAALRHRPPDDHYGEAREAAGRAVRIMSPRRVSGAAQPHPPPHVDDRARLASRGARQGVLCSGPEATRVGRIFEHLTKEGPCPVRPESGPARSSPAMPSRLATAGPTPGPGGEDWVVATGEVEDGVPAEGARLRHGVRRPKGDGALRRRPDEGWHRYERFAC